MPKTRPSSTSQRAGLRSPRSSTRSGEDAEAESLLRDALDVFERVYGDTHYEVAVTLNNLAAILHRRGALGEAESLYRRALAINEQVRCKTLDRPRRVKRCVRLEGEAVANGGHRGSF